MHIHLKTYKDKIKYINKIVFNSASDEFENIIHNFNNNLENAFIIIITNFTIIFINNNKIIINEQKRFMMKLKMRH